MDYQLCPICEDNEVSMARWNLGYHCCLICGAKNAYQEALRKSQRTAPAWNKGAYQYITNGDDPRTLGRKV